MSKRKVSFHGSQVRNPSPAQEIVPVPPANVHVAVPPANVQIARARSGPRPGGGAGPAVNGQFVLHALRRWWKVALPAGLLLAATAAGIVYWLFEPQYEAAALLEINERPQYIAFEPKDAGVSKGYFRTQMELIRSPWILGLAVANEKVKELPEIRKQRDPVEWLKKRVTVVSANDSDVFQIKYSSNNPENAALLVNEVTKQYLTAQEKEESERTRSIIAALTDEMTNREKAVRSLRGEVQSMTQKVSGKEPELARPDSNSQTRNPLGELQNRLITLQVDRAMLSARIKAGEEDLRAAERADAAQNATKTKAAAAPLSKEELELRDAMVAKAIAESVEVKQQELLLAARRAKLSQVEELSKRGKEDPTYIRRQKEIASGEKSLDEMKQKMTALLQKEVELSLRAKRSDGEVGMLAKRCEEVARMRSELRGYEIAEVNLRTAYSDQMKKFLKELEQVSGENVNLTFMRDELVESQKVLERITERQIALQTERAAPPRVIWHDRHGLPRLRSRICLTGTWPWRSW